MKYDLKGDCLIEVCGEACDACLAVAPNCKAVAESFNLRFVKISIEDDPEAVEKFSLSRIPSIILTRDGEVLATCSGYQPQEILEYWVQAKLGNG